MFYESIFVVVLFLIYLILWTVKRITQRKQTGIDPEVLGNNNNPLQVYFGRIIKLLTVFIVILIFIHSTGFQYYSAFSTFPPLDSFSVDLMGFLLGLGGLGICAIAQKTMGNSWRVGIDEEKETDLITTGVFAYIRNPTYSGLFLLLIGTWLIWPTWTIGIFATIFFFCIEVQVRCEEDYLLKTHGAEYQEYKTQTCRYFPVNVFFKRK